LLSSAATDGAEGVLVLDAIARRHLPSIPALGFAADIGGALVAAGVLSQQRRDRARRSASAGAPGLRAAGSTTPGASCGEGPP
jgi:hypothetical protein